MEKLIRRNGIRRTGGIRDMFYSMCRILSGTLLHTKSFICSSITIHGRVKRIYIYFFFQITEIFTRGIFHCRNSCGTITKIIPYPKTGVTEPPAHRHRGSRIFRPPGRVTRVRGTRRTVIIPRGN